MIKDKSIYAKGFKSFFTPGPHYPPEEYSSLEKRLWWEGYDAADNDETYKQLKSEHYI